jgi:AcrR family transcriptional regulator
MSPEQPRARSEETRARIVRSAAETLIAEGFAGASARAIAARGGFNQALIFYHFGTVRELLLAALDETSARRLAAYREAAAAAEDLAGLMAVAAHEFREDLDSGHIKILAELISGSSASPELGPAIVVRVEPWIAFTREQVERVAAATPVGSLLPSDDVAFAIVALFLGLELMTHLEGDRSRALRLFEWGAVLAGFLGALAPPGKR